VLMLLMSLTPQWPYRSVVAHRALAQLALQV